MDRVSDTKGRELAVLNHEHELVNVIAKALQEAHSGMFVTSVIETRGSESSNINNILREVVVNTYPRGGGPTVQCHPFDVYTLDEFRDGVPAVVRGYTGGIGMHSGHCDLLDSIRKAVEEHYARKDAPAGRPQVEVPA